MTDHLRILLATSEKIAASIENAIKYQAAADSATVDYLTGLPNARSLFLHLDSEISRCKREQTHLAAVVCDLDGFKQINDKLGHLAGNHVLELFARKLTLSCREYDFASRMGGDEFVVIAPRLDRRAAEEMTVRVKTVAAESAREVCAELTLSASVGVAFYPDDGEDAEQLLVTADKRMYSMKHEHRPTKAFLELPLQTPTRQ